MKNNGKFNFAENSIYSQILWTYIKRNEHFSILKILKILFNENFLLFINYKTKKKKKSKLFNFKKISKISFNEINANVDFAESSINTLILII